MTSTTTDVVSKYIQLLVIACINCTYEVWLVCLGEELFQELCPEIIEHLLQVNIGASVVMPQVLIQVREDLGVLGVHGTPGGGE